MRFVMLMVIQMIILSTFTAVSAAAASPAKLTQFWSSRSFAKSGTFVVFHLVFDAEPGPGSEVRLSTSDPVALPLPGIIRADLEQEFAVKLPLLAEDRDVTATAEFGDTTLTLTLSIEGPLPMLHLLDPCMAGGSAQRAEVYLTNPAPAGGLTIALTSTNSALLQVPASITIPADSFQNHFFITAAAAFVTDTATVSLKHNGVKATVFLTVQPGTDWVLSSITPADPSALLLTYFASAYGINASGDIVGTMSDTTGIVAFLYRGGKSSVLATSDNHSAVPCAISDSGLVVGALSDPQKGYDVPARYSAAQWVPLSGKEGRAVAVNAHDAVVGWYAPASEHHAFFFDDSLVDLGTLGGLASEAVGINSDNVVAGWSEKDTTGRRAFIWTAETGMKELPVPEWCRDAVASGINGSGLVVGEYMDGSGAIHACAWYNGVFSEIDSSSSRATAVNDAGLIVGLSDDRPVIWKAAQRIFLDSAAFYSCGMFTVPLAINSTGTIIGNRHNEQHHSEISSDIAVKLQIPAQLTGVLPGSPPAGTSVRNVPAIQVLRIAGRPALRYVSNGHYPAGLQVFRLDGRLIKTAAFPAGLKDAVVRFDEVGIASGALVVAVRSGPFFNVNRLVFPR